MKEVAEDGHHEWQMGSVYGQALSQSKWEGRWHCVRDASVPQQGQKQVNSQSNPPLGQQWRSPSTERFSVPGLPIILPQKVLMKVLWRAPKLPQSHTNPPDSKVLYTRSWTKKLNSAQCYSCYSQKRGVFFTTHREFHLAQTGWKRWLPWRAECPPGNEQYDEALMQPFAAPLPESAGE